jgi:hypothetical protein
MILVQEYHSDQVYGLGGSWLQVHGQFLVEPLVKGIAPELTLQTTTG